MDALLQVHRAIFIANLQALTAVIRERLMQALSAVFYAQLRDAVIMRPLLVALLSLGRIAATA